MSVATVKEIVDRACVERPFGKQAYPDPVPAKVFTELRQKRNDLCSITSQELEAYWTSKMKFYMKHCSEESKAALSYVVLWRTGESSHDTRQVLSTSNFAAVSLTWALNA
ncbi:hypothetical protein ABBQ38_008594 [Trebouxia sp. C0009 RCD-2024]